MVATIWRLPNHAAEKTNNIISEIKFRNVPLQLHSDFCPELSLLQNPQTAQLTRKYSFASYEAVKDCFVKKENSEMSSSQLHFDVFNIKL